MQCLFEATGRTGGDADQFWSLPDLFISINGSLMLAHELWTKLGFYGNAVIRATLAITLVQNSSVAGFAGFKAYSRDRQNKCPPFCEILKRRGTDCKSGTPRTPNHPRRALRMVQVASLFNPLLDHFPKLEFGALVRKHEADKGAKGFSPWTQ